MMFCQVGIYKQFLIGKLYRAFPVAQMVKRLPTRRETQVRPLGQEDPLEKGMATHSGILAWRIHGQWSLAGYSLVSQRVKHG